eukprot:SAG22_NODE_2681_length_2313_cov_2.675700_2_plen_66_part_00
MCSIAGNPKLSCQLSRTDGTVHVVVCTVGYCLNGPAARRAAEHPLEAVCDEIDYPDDMALGYLVR